MALINEQIYTEGLAQMSYIVGDDSAGVVAVIDPRRDVEVYVERAREKGLRITAIVETHIHADFVSGAGELSARTGAEIYGGKSDDYQFELVQMVEGDEIELGAARLHALHTPGHTPEHISLLLFDKRQGDEAFAVFSGDTLFNLEAGRPDLLGDEMKLKLAGQLYHSLFDKIAPLGDRFEIYPGHGSGSGCGAKIGDRLQTTVGNEKLFSNALKKRTEEEFVEWILKGMPEPPRYYPRLKKVNARGAKVFGSLPLPAPLSVAEFQAEMKKENAIVVDARSILAFGGGHIKGAMSIALRSEFPMWAGWMLEADQNILLVVESERDVKAVAEHLFRTGYDNVVGYLHNGMTAWQNAALPLEKTGEWTVHKLAEKLDDEDLQILDVRGEGEWQQGNIPHAEHIYVPHLEANLDRLDKDKTTIVYCGSGYRASIAASVLQRNDFKSVVNIPGSWTAWEKAGLPIEDDAELKKQSA
jgi:hydroxyacylglutathione hydrolase